MKKAIASRRTLYPAIEPNRSGWLRVSPVHEIYWEESGNPQGKPAVFVHGGPGGGADPRIAQVLRPEALPHRGVRPARLRPEPPAREPRGQHDLASRRRHGAAARAPRHRALAGVRRLVGLDARARLCRRRTRRASANSCCAASSCCASGKSTGSTRTARARCFPTAGSITWRRYRRASAATSWVRIYRRLTSPSRATRVRAARAWSIWEAATSHLQTDEANIDKWGEEKFAVAVARIECHYFVNKGFMRREDQLLRGVAEDPRHPRGDRPGPLRRRLPDPQRLGPAPALAGGRVPPRARRRALGTRARHHPRARGCDRPVRDSQSDSRRRSTRSARSRAIASRRIRSSRSFASTSDSLKLIARVSSTFCGATTCWSPRCTEYSTS